MFASISIVVASMFLFAASFRLERKNIPPSVADSGVLADFSRTGNFSPNGLGWKLIYEEPGSPALSAALIFSEDSICGGTVCVPSYFSAGDRVMIEGAKTGEGSVLVVRLTYVN